MFPIPIPNLPNPYILIGAVVLLLAAFFGGHHIGYINEHEKFIAYKAEVKAVADLAEAKNKEIVAHHEAITANILADSTAKLNALQEKANAALKAQQAQFATEKSKVTKGIENTYENKIDAIHAAYAGRLRGVANQGSGNLSSFSFTTPNAYDRTSYDLLASNCAITTQMLVSLQEWVVKEGEVR